MKLKRYAKNPILEPNEKNDWESQAVFNCTVAFFDGKFHMLYRAIGEYKNYISRLGYAVSDDGINFERKCRAVIIPNKKYDAWGCEDPRITEIEGRFLITYTALCQPAREGGCPPRVALASTRDFVKFQKHGTITPANSPNKDVVIFPEKIKGKYVMLHRPSDWIEENIVREKGKLSMDIRGKKLAWTLKEKPKYFPDRPSIWIAYSEDLRNWHGHKVIIEPEEKWESSHIGSGPAPIKTDKGWLLLYHGVEYKNKSMVYKGASALLDLKNPEKIVGRSKNPILEPKKPYEKRGDVNNVVFPEGMVKVGKNLYVYYGAGDKVCCLATCHLDKLLNYTLN